MNTKLIKLIYCILLAVGCRNSLDIDTYKNTVNDEFADITFLGNSFYTTNNDNSMNAGSQIDLFRFSEDESFIEDAFDLEMNGQGYLAITNDGTNLYLQSHNDTYILKVSPVGERFYMHWMEFSDTYIDENGNDQWDDGETLIVDYNENGFWDYGNDEWVGSGITYIDEEDSLFVLYQNIYDHRKLLGRKVNPNSLQVGSISFSEWNILDSTNSIFAMEYVNLPEYSLSKFYYLAQDTTGTVILLTTDSIDLNFSVVDIDAGSALGMGWDKNCSLFFSYPDRLIAEVLNFCE